MYAGWSLTMQQDGPLLNEYRRILQKCIGPNTLPQHDHVIQEELASFLPDISNKCVDPFKVLTE